MKRMNNKEIFLEQVLPILTDYCGFDKRIAIAHALHECGDSWETAGRFNFWGLKPPNFFVKHLSEYITLTLTHEFEKGKSVKQKAGFLQFATPLEGALVYARQIERMYPRAWMNRQIINGFVNGLIWGKYATDPNYRTKFLKRYEEVSLLR